jgi:predicted AAA+ superfamily ATPase
MRSFLTEKNDIKIFILFLMQNIGTKLDFDTIAGITIYEEYVNYFDFAECFTELADAGHIVKVDENGKTYYTISETGYLVATQLKSAIVEPIREKSIKSAFRILSLKERGMTVSASSKPDGNDRYDVNLLIKERDSEVFNLQIKVASLGQANKIKANFYDRPETMLRGIYAMLTGDADYLFEK